MKPYSTSLRLKEIMSKHNLKQIDILNACKPLCNKYNVKFGKSDLSQYISGKVEPGQEKLSVLAEALKVSEAWLMGYDVPMQDNGTEVIGTRVKKQPTETSELSEQDKEIISLIANLPEDKRREAINYIKFISAQRQNEDNQ